MTDLPESSVDAARPAAVLFDMDGLLVRTEPMWFDVECLVMERLGGTWTKTDQLKILGKTLDWSAAYLVDRAGADVGSEVVVGWMVEEMERLLRSRAIAWMPGAPELLDSLNADGIPTALVSASHRRLVDAVLAAARPRRFDATVAGDEVRNGKPDPEPYQRAASLLGVAPERCVVLEDSPNGAQSALAAGCITIMVPDPSVAELVTAPEGAAVVGSLTEMMPFWPSGAARR